MESPKATRPKKLGKQPILRKGGGSGKGGRCGKWGNSKDFQVCSEQFLWICLKISLVLDFV